MEVTAFLELFRHALDCIDETYYGNAKLGRYGERIFCYELYHQIRTLMPDSALRLQGELRKPPVPIDEQVSKRYGIQSLPATYVPDFLFHSPGNFSHQCIVIEVKSNPQTEPGDIRKDLTKIQMLLTRYQYQQGIFLIVNTPVKLVRWKMRVSQTQELIAHHLPDRSRILFLSKEQRGARTYECSLDRIAML